MASPILSPAIEHDVSISVHWCFARIHLFLTCEYAKRNERVIGNDVLYLESFNGTLKPICRLKIDFQ